MRRLVYLIAATIDGFIADPSGSDPSGTVFVLDGDHAEPLMHEYPEMVPAPLRPAVGLENAANRHFDTVLEGRRSYVTGLEQDVTNAYPHMRHYVFSRTLTEAPDPGIEIVTADPVTKVKELKREEGKDIWLCGGGSLAATLREEVDEIHLKLNPVTVGTGTPLFDGDFQIRRYSLADSRTFASGVVLLRYVRPEQSARP